MSTDPPNPIKQIDGLMNGIHIIRMATGPTIMIIAFRRGHLTDYAQSAPV